MPRWRAVRLNGILATLDWFAQRPRLTALLGAACISFSGIFYRFAEVSPSTGTIYRAIFGLPILVTVAVAERRRYGPLPPDAIRLAAIAGLFFAGDLMFWHHAIGAVGAGLATVLGNLQVIVVGFVAWLVLGERPSRSTLLALPIVLLGVVLISGVVGSGAYGAAPAIGVVLGVCTALFYAGYLLVIRRGGRDPRRPAGPVAVATIVVVLVSASVSTPRPPTTERVVALNRGPWVAEPGNLSALDGIGGLGATSGRGAPSAVRAAAAGIGADDQS